MANLAEKHKEQQSAQLADAEISRILSTLQKAEFKRSETGNELPDQTFKPRSLMEIAETTNQQVEAALDDKDYDVPPSVEDAPADDIAPEVTGDGQLNEQPSTDALDNLPQDTGMNLPTAEPNAPDSEELTTTDADVDLAAPTSSFETAKMAYDRGYADGILAGREAAEDELRDNIEAEFQAKLAHKIDAFESALTALKKPQASDVNSLSASLQAAVVRLAAARTGMEIDELPELLLKRIEELADAAGKNVSAGKLFLHPDDCALITPIMMERQCTVKIEADSQLYRGDVRIRFDGMDISDIADLRANWKISKQTPDRRPAEAELSQTSISEVGQEIQNSNNPSENLQADSAQSNTTPSSTISAENGNLPVDKPDGSEDASNSNPIGLMPLTTIGGEEEKVPDQGTEEHEEASTPSSIGLMPLTTTGGEEEKVPDQGTEEHEEASTTSSIDLMPLTSRNVDE